MNISRVESYENGAGFELEFDLLAKGDEKLLYEVISSFFMSMMSETPPSDNELMQLGFKKGSRYIFEYESSNSNMTLRKIKDTTKNFTVRLSPSDEYLIGEKSKQYGFKSIGEYLRFVGIHSDINVKAPTPEHSPQQPKTKVVKLIDLIESPNKLSFPLLVIVDNSHVKAMKEEKYLRHYFDEPIELSEWAMSCLDFDKENPNREHKVIENVPLRENHLGLPDICTMGTIAKYSNEQRHK